MEGRALLLYDGVCALCHGMVKFLIKRDRRDRFRYAPLQSELGREMLGRFGIEGFPEFFLATFARSFLGTLGAVDDYVAGSFGAQLGTKSISWADEG